MASLWVRLSDTFSRLKNGLVPKAPSGTGTTKYLREDGTWAVPSGGGYHKYSTTEQVVGEWVDGKPLYERSYHFIGQFYGNVSIGNIGINDLDNIIDIRIANYSIEGGVKGATKGIAFAHSNAVNNYGIFIAQNGSIELRSGSAYTSSLYIREFFITLRYTKTTD